MPCLPYAVLTSHGIPSYPTLPALKLGFHFMSSGSSPRLPSPQGGLMALLHTPTAPHHAVCGLLTSITDHDLHEDEALSAFLPYSPATLPGIPLLNVWMGGWMEGWIDDGLMMERQMDGWMDD